MAKYDKLADPTERIAFLSLFQQNGCGKGHNALKFVFEFQASLSHDEETKTTNNENMLSAGSILELHGTNFSEFSNINEALKDVEHLVAKNQVDFEWTEDEHPPQIDDANPKYNKYYYVKSDGKTVTHKQITTKRLEGSAKLKNIKELEHAMAFMEGVGMGIGDDPSTVQITNENTAPSRKVVTRFGHPVCSSTQTIQHICKNTIDPQHEMRCNVPVYAPLPCPPPLPVHPVSKSGVGGEGMVRSGGALGTLHSV